MLVPADSIVPVIVVNRSVRWMESVLINTGSNYFGYSLAAWLRHCGYSHIDTLILLDNRKRYYGGLPKVMAVATVGTAVIISRDRRNLDAIRHDLWSAGTRTRLFLNAETAAWQGFRVRQSGDFGERTYQCETDEPGGGQLQIDIAVRPQRHTVVSVRRRTITGRLMAAKEWKLRYSDHDRLIDVD